MKSKSQENLKYHLKFGTLSFFHNPSTLSLSLKHTYNTKALEANLETKAPEKRVETHTIVAKKKNNRIEPKVFNSQNIF